VDLFSICLLSKQHSEKKKFREELVGVRPFIIGQLASQQTQILTAEEDMR
jgi:hypothetical protein